MKNNEKIIWEQYIDIHSHILPGIDDGSENFLMSLQMLRTAAESGITKIILTPHNKPGRHNAGPLKIASLTEKLKEEMAEENIDIGLYPGNEIHYRSGLTEALDAGECLSLSGSAYVLTEFSPMDDYGYIRNGIYDLLAGGYRPILAHAERYGNVCGRKGGTGELVEMGCYIQVNAGSIMGASGSAAKAFTRKLLAKGLVHFVATDAHDMGKRPPEIRECASFIGKKYGGDYMRELLYENPMHVIRNEFI